MMLSLGVIDGRNMWRADLEPALAPWKRRPAERLVPSGSWSAPRARCCTARSISTGRRAGRRTEGWLAFAKQKLHEIRLWPVRSTRAGPRWPTRWRPAARRSRAAAARRGSTIRRCRAAGRRRRKHAPPYAAVPRAPQAQREKLGLPPLPTTTIGSFPQTTEVRKARAALKKGDWTVPQYEAFCRDEIARTVRFQEEIGLDVLVHGEFERNDMVEYFGEQLEGFAFTSNGWVQSYGTRCVKPPIIYGDVWRAAAR